MNTSERNPFIDSIIDVVCSHMGVTREKLLLQESNGRGRRKREESHARWAIMYFINLYNPHIFQKEICWHLNLTERSSVSTGIKGIKSILLTPTADKTLYRNIIELKNKFTYKVFGNLETEEELIDREIEQILDQVGI